MKVITEPTVQVISKPQFIECETFEIPDDGDDNVKIGALAAKACYDSRGKDGRSNIANQVAILEHGHGSVLEHIHIGLFIEGITRGLSLELNRHRTFNISQRSTRYTEEDNSAIVLNPFYSKLWIKHNLMWCDEKHHVVRVRPENQIELSKDDLQEIILIKDHVNNASISFLNYSMEVERNMLLNPYGYEGFHLRKWARGMARNAAPGSLETKGTWTNNVRGWRWFIESRSAEGALPEIRRLADVVLRTLREVAPVYFEDFESLDSMEGIPIWSTRYRKV